MVRARVLGPWCSKRPERPGVGGEERRSCYSFGRRQTGVLDPNLTTKMKSKMRGRDCYRRIVVTRPKVTRNFLETHEFARKMDEFPPRRSRLQNLGTIM
ncbi:hypothetical protein DVH24_027661 [Malus domestica]|uniref:Uncharacterized protein n=1 Tax=Malus domestica TaxID=3750 RepID=A0A498HB92_MALDO|nr:hypothetical protein DVH24_027661 [Malus domestica]